MIELKENDLYIFEGRILKLIKTKYNKNNKQTGLRPTLKLLTQQELNALIIKEVNNGMY